jgi:serine protease
MKTSASALFRPALAALLCLAWGAGSYAGASAEWNPVSKRPVSIGPEANRLLVGFKATSGNAVTKTIKLRSRVEPFNHTQALTSATDVVRLAQRTGFVMAGSRQITPSMHVVFLDKTLYGADVAAALAVLRADPEVLFADVDQQRYPHSVMPDDPLFVPTPGVASGQWYLGAPAASVTVEGVQTMDLAATDAVDAWSITEGSSGTVIADVDSGILFNHPDLLRAGFGGRLLPGYDFVGQDYNRSNSQALGTFLIANDGDGWDPDPSDPGDWVSATDMQNTEVFPPADCGNPNSSPVDAPVNSSWHGTRVVGVLGALTNNDVGIAGMTWNPYILPVRALGKCGGFDSDIIAGIQWSVGMTVMDGSGNTIVDNPYPADIINLSLGGSGSCPSDYQDVLATLTSMGVLVVASAGNESGPVDAPGNCAGVLAVAGLRNVGTKVGYSSLGPEVGVGAPAGNCVNLSGNCLRSIDTTTNDGLMGPGNNTYTNETNPNLGTSFSAPIVSGIAALMRAVNGNLTPPQLIARIEASASAYPQPVGTPVCSNSVSSDVECACTATTCGAGMVNALSAVMAALNPIAAIKIPANLATGSGSYDGSGSVAACGATIKSYAWSATGGVSVPPGSTGSQVTANWNGTAGTLVLIVTDSTGNTDTDTVTFTTTGATTSGPSSGGSSANACTASMTVTPAAPTLGAAFAPASVAPNATTMLTLTLSNTNSFALTQSGITDSLPANLTLLTTPAPATTCTGANMTLTSSTSSVTLADANIPASGSCQITLSVKSATAGNYTNTLGVNALMTGPAGGNAAGASAALDVTAAAGGSGSSDSGGKSGGGALDMWDLMLLGGVLLAGRRGAARYNRKDGRSQ